MSRFDGHGTVQDFESDVMDENEQISLAKASMHKA